MKKAHWALAPLALIALTSARAEDEIPGPQVGDAFPHTLEALDQNGDRQSLESLYGENGTAVFFVRSADWCPFCKRQLADVNARLDEFDALGLSVVSISVDEVPLIKQFYDAEGIGYAMLAGPERRYQRVARHPRYAVPGRQRPVRRASPDRLHHRPQRHGQGPLYGTDVPDAS